MLSRFIEAKSTLGEDRKGPRDTSKSDSTSSLDQHPICGRRQPEHVDNTAPMLAEDALYSGREAASYWDKRVASAHTTTPMSLDTLAIHSLLQQLGSQHKTITRREITSRPTMTNTCHPHSECESCSGGHLGKPGHMDQVRGGHWCPLRSPRRPEDEHTLTEPFSAILAYFQIMRREFCVFRSDRISSVYIVSNVCVCITIL